MVNLNKELIAPCGMNCGICSAYLAYKNDIPRKNQETKYKCQKCNNLISVHSKKCYVCDEITSWKS